MLPLTFESANKAFTSTGDVVFHVGGMSTKLKTFILGEELFVIFQDETNGVEDVWRQGDISTLRYRKMV